MALTVHLDDSGVVHEAVYGRDCHGGTWKNVRPSGERLVGGDGDGVSFVSVSDELEQGTGLYLVLSHIRQLVEYDEVVLVEFVEHRRETELAASGLKLLHHIGGCGKQDAATGIDEGVADGGIT
ncbi:hypothetical protein ABID25_006446 [Mesorhizobium abyssinicae]